jgi:uncharacterized protein (DUF1697 family)
MRRPDNQPLTTYVALLRGVNVGGNNKISMASLKVGFGHRGFKDVTTYINSGNVIFRANEGDARKLESDIEKMLLEEYGLDCKVVVRSFAEIAKLIKSLPKTWGGDEDLKYNVVFLRHSIDSRKILDGLHPKPDIEEVIYRPGTLLWSARTSDLTRSAMIKLPGQEVYQDMTVRSLNTTRKLFELMKKAAES